MDPSEYCREIESYLCRKNDGHLIRISGPSFEVVSRWARDGVPLKVALAGIDRYFERYYRKGPRRRPVRIDFCDADVLDVFDEWRRATGVAALGANDGQGAPELQQERRRGRSLPEHLERALLKLSNLRASGALADGADPVLDCLSTELDAARSNSAGVRSDARRAMLARLDRLDTELVAHARHSLDAGTRDRLAAEAAAELAPYRERMAAEAFAAALDAATRRLVRDRLGLPVIAFEG